MLRHLGAQTFEGVVAVHLHPIARSRQSHFELLPQRAVRVQRDDPVGQNDRLVHIIGDQHAGFLVSLPDPLNLVGKVRTGQRIKCGEWFIQEQHLGVHYQRTGDIDPLTHPARKFCRTAAGRMREPHHLDEMRDFFSFLDLRHIGEDRIDGQLHIARHRQPRQQRVTLKDHAAFRIWFLDCSTLEGGGAAGGAFKPRHEVDKRRLARAGEAEDDKELTLLHIQIDVFQNICPICPLTEGFADVF